MSLPRGLHRRSTVIQVHYWHGPVDRGGLRVETREKPTGRFSLLDFEFSSRLSRLKAVDLDPIRPLHSLCPYRASRVVTRLPGYEANSKLSTLEPGGSLVLGGGVHSSHSRQRRETLIET